jgi:flagellar biosynthetic protein FliP
MNPTVIDSSVNAAQAAASTGGPTSATQLVVILALASLIPAIVLTCTCFARFVVVFSFLRNGLATQGAPPNQVLVGLALFMSFFVMAPVAEPIYAEAVVPYMNGTIDEGQAIDAATPHLRTFLIARTRESDLELFYEVSQAERPTSTNDVPLRIAIPAFVVSELGTAFRIGLIILLPFLVIDMIVAAVLSALGMVMLPPPIVSLPVKLLVFVAIDGWHLVVASLLKGAM